MDSQESLWRGVPRLDRPDRLWLLPAPQARWLGAGIISGPLLAQLLGSLGGAGPAGAWSLPVVWLVWLAGAIVGAAGAFWRPGGLHLGEWGAVLVDFVLVPRRAVWKPTGDGEWTG